MRIFRRIVLAVLALVVVAALGFGIYLAVSPPEILRVADNFTAKTICSNVFLAGRDAATVLGADVQAPGNPILRLVKVEVDDKSQMVTARFLGFAAPGISIYRPGLGCAAVPDGNVEAARMIGLDVQPEISPPGDALWPQGGYVAPSTDSRLADLLADSKLTGPGMRAVVVVRDGRIVAEKYGPGVGAATPLLGWSMSKTVNVALLGIVAQQGKLALEQADLLPEWAGDERKIITLSSLLGMTSGLSFNEDYGDVTDVTRMLYLEPDMPGFAARQPVKSAPGAEFSYSTGTAMLLSRIWMSRLPDAQTALQFPRAALFGPLGMTTATFESDERGTFAGGSYVYASARDWARFGEFLLEGGELSGKRLLQPSFIHMMASSNGLGGGYSQAQTWILGPHESEPGEAPVGLPAGTFWLEGHDGQSVAIIPSRQLVVVRMGLTPWDENYWPEYLVKAIVDAAP